MRLRSQTGDVYDFNTSSDPSYIKTLIAQGYVPEDAPAQITLGQMGIGYNGPDWNQQVSQYGSPEKLGAKNIMEGYRDFGADNPYINREYGADNPYLTKAMEGIGNLEDIASSTDPSAYANALLDQQDIIKKMNMEDLTKGFSSDLATAYNTLAETGGLSQGSRERLQAGGMQNKMFATQRLGAENAAARAGILAGDMGFKQNLLTQIPGMYNPYAQGMENWNQQLGLAKEQYEQQKAMLEKQTEGNLYSRESY
jgi:hypothetical protein